MKLRGIKQTMFGLLVLTLLSTNAFADFAVDGNGDPIATLDMSVTVNPRLNFGVWGKKLTGDVDPGIAAGTPIDYDENTGEMTPIDFELGYEGSSYKDVNGNWYCLFFAMDSGNSYSLQASASIETKPGADDVFKGILVQPGFAAGDQFTQEGDFGIIYYYDDSTVQAGETIGRAQALAEDPNFAASYEKVTYSVNSLRTPTNIYSNNTTGITRIMRVYISAMDLKADGQTDYAAQQSLINSGEIAPIENVPEGDYAGTLTFTMVVNN